MILSAFAVTAQRSPEARVDTGDAAGASASRGPRFAASESTLYAVWQDERNARLGPTDVLFNRSTDGGGTWLADPIRLDTGSAPGSAVSIDVDLSAGGSRRSKTSTPIARPMLSSAA